jgi:hypothetical protein
MAASAIATSITDGKTVASKGLAARNKVIRTAFGPIRLADWSEQKMPGRANPEIPIRYVILLWRHPAVM